MSEKNASVLRTTTFGKECNMPQLHGFLRREFKLNRRNYRAGLRRRVPLIWGPPGIGKTDVVKGFAEVEKDADGVTIEAEDRGYIVKHVPVGQFEEMGDINGIPKEELDAKTKTFITKMCPPDWVPNKERDGKKVILLLDDINRADARIIKGTMQLIQDYGMTSWGLHEEDYQIVCTANPEGGVNDVTPLDPAQISRFSHVTLKIDGRDGAVAWAKWADKNKVDKRAISFILSQPEMLFTGRDRVNPRTWTQAFDILHDIPHAGPGQPLNKEQAEIMSMHVEACVDPDAAGTFLTFMTKGIMEMIEPEEILNKLDEVWPKLRALSGRAEKDNEKEKQKAGRIDCLFAIFERLYLYIRSEEFQVKTTGDTKLSTKQSLNLCKVLSGDLAGQDMRWGIARRLFWESEKTKAKMKEVMTLAKAQDKSIANELTKMLADAVTT